MTTLTLTCGCQRQSRTNGAVRITGRCDEGERLLQVARAAEQAYHAEPSDAHSRTWALALGRYQAHVAVPEVPMSDELLSMETWLGQLETLYGDIRATGAMPAVQIVPGATREDAMEWHAQCVRQAESDTLWMVSLVTLDADGEVKGDAPILALTGNGPHGEQLARFIQLAFLMMPPLIAAARDWATQPDGERAP